MNEPEGAKKEVEEPMFEKVERSIYQLESAVTRFENLLNKFEQGEHGPSCETTEKQQPTLVRVWRTVASKVEGNTKELHGLMDRLEELFR